VLGFPEELGDRSSLVRRPGGVPGAALIPPHALEELARNRGVTREHPCEERVLLAGG
jgi:hypothetical protein